MVMIVIRGNHYAELDLLAYVIIISGAGGEP